MATSGREFFFNAYFATNLPAPDYSAGDRIVHQAFGAGTLTKMTPMGGDFLIEISFDSGSTKKLMLRAAAPHMKKA